MARHTVEWDRAVHTKAQFPKSNWRQVAFAGRSNVGKSSLLNRIFGQKLAGVSQTPGKTRSVNFYRVDGFFFLVDLPGYGYAKVAKTQRQQFSALTGYYLEETNELTGVVQLMDLRHPPTALDERVCAYLGELDKEHLIVLTKADKLSRSAANKNRDVAAKLLRRRAEDLIVFSAVDGRGVSEVWSWIGKQIKGVKEDA